MGEPPARLTQFLGSVRCQPDPAGPLGLTLRGRSAQYPQQELEVAFAAAAPADLPQQLRDACIECDAPGEYRITAGGRSWRLSARSVHVHRDAGAPFYQAIPGRPAPLGRRLLFAAMLALARSRLGVALLRAARR